MKLPPGHQSNQYTPPTPHSTGIAIGGDSFPGSTLSDHCIRYQNIPQIKMIVVLGELGGQDEYSLVEAIKSGKVCVWKERLGAGD